MVSFQLEELMSTRTLTFLFSTLLAFSLSSWAQRVGGAGAGGPVAGTGHSSTNNSSAANSNASFGASEVSALTADQEGKIKFHTQSILVQVPIVVTDKSGNHIHGLTKEDFHVLENGKEQKISTFEEIITTNTKLPTVTAKPGEFTNLALADQQPRTVTVIALDTINTPFLDQANGRRELVKFLADNLNSGQVLALMIMTPHGVRVVQGLTGDPEQLVQVLKRASGELPALQGIGPDQQVIAAEGNIPDLTLSATPTTTAGIQAQVNAFLTYGDTLYAGYAQQKAVEDTLNSFLGIAWSLSGVPGRKSLIWATGGFPFEISSPAQLPGGYNNALYERTMQALTAGQISVYPVDVRGLVNNSVNGSAVSTAGFTAGGTTGRGTVQQGRDWLQQSTILTLDEFADMTGGKAYHDTNDLASSFKRAADDASSYYLAGYYLDTHNNNSGWRQLKVKVNKADTQVRARQGFFVTNASMNLDETRTTDLIYALSSPIEGTGVPMSVKWLGTSGDGAKKKTEFMIHMPADGISIEGSNGQNHLNFDFAAAAYVVSNKKEKPAATIGKAVNATIPDAQMASLRASGIDMKNALELGPGNYVVRVVIRDNVTGKIGTVTAPLTVN
jgi:VWFA-related protein